MRSGRIVESPQAWSLIARPCEQLGQLMFAAPRIVLERICVPLPSPMHTTVPRVPPKEIARMTHEDFAVFRDFKLRLHLILQAVILKALESSGFLDCYESFDLSVQVRGKKIDGFEIRERPPLLPKENA